MCFILSCGDVLLILAAQQEDTAEQAAEQQYANADAGGGLLRLHLLKRDGAEDQRKDRPESDDHTDDDEYFCRCFHKPNTPLIKDSQALGDIIILYS